MDAEQLARLFHETYERLAPKHSYQTRRASAVLWENVPANNKALMIEVAGEILQAIQTGRRIPTSMDKNFEGK